MIVYLEGFSLLNLFWNQLMDSLTISVRNLFTFGLFFILTIFFCNITTILNRFWFATSIRLVFAFLIRFSFGLLYFLTFCLSLNHQIWIFEVVITNCYLLYLPNQNTCWCLESKLLLLPHLSAILEDIQRHIYHCTQCLHRVILYKLCNNWTLTRIDIFPHTLFDIPFLALVSKLVQIWSYIHFCENGKIQSIRPF